MNLSITEDFRPLSELESHSLALAQQARSIGRPVIVTAEGKPDVVILSADAFQRQIALVNLATLLAEGETDLKQGRTRRAREFFKELRGGKTKVRR